MKLLYPCDICEIPLKNRIGCETDCPRLARWEGYHDAIKWLSEPCTEHPVNQDDADAYPEGMLNGLYLDARLNCPECWKEVQK